jgi:hypothetical protein
MSTALGGSRDDRVGMPLDLVALHAVYAESRVISGGLRGDPQRKARESTPATLNV